MRQAIPFGKYLLLDRISVGGMAEVFKAKSYGVEGFEKVIAIKRILPSMGEDRDFIKMFIDEAKIAGQLAHANICQIFELGRIDGAHFIAMEFIWGKDLLQIQNRLRKLKQTMTPAMACFVVGKVCEGLDYAHRKRDPMGRPLEIVHRDCSPQNVIVSYEGEVKIIDFGIAKAASRSSRTMHGVLKGKFGYMSPEQVRGLPLDRRSDIFALGTILYECLTGDRLFQGDTDFAILEKVRNVDIIPPRQLNPAIPEEVERIIMKSLARDVENRYQWCSEMLADLQAFLMAQPAVFTAKALAAWMKEGFVGELEKERQQLEAYKKLGREGLIAGVPAAQAKLDLVEHLGAAGQAEDPTVLGGPSFEDVLPEGGATQISDMSAFEMPPQVDPNLGPVAGEVSARSGTERDSRDSFPEEDGPTTIFGELGDDDAPTLNPVTSQPAALPAPPPRPAGRSTTQAPAVPPPRTPTSPPVAPIAHAGAMPTASAQARTLYGMAPPAVPFPAGTGPGRVQATPNPGGYQSAAPTDATVMGLDAGALPVDQLVLQAQAELARARAEAQALQAAGHNADARTMMAMHAPQLPLQPEPPSGVQPAYAPAGYPPQPWQQPGWDPNQPNGYASYTPSGMLISPPTRHGGDPAVVTAVGKPEKRRPSLGKDVAIGVAIAAVVLGLVAMVKFVILGDDGGTRTASAGSIVVTVPDGQKAEVFVGAESKGLVQGTMTLEKVAAGEHEVRVVRDGADPCAKTVAVAGGATATVECKFAAAAPPPPAVDAAPVAVTASVDAGVPAVVPVDAAPAVVPAVDAAEVVAPEVKSDVEIAKADVERDRLRDERRAEEKKRREEKKLEERRKKDEEAKKDDDAKKKDVVVKKDDKKKTGTGTGTGTGSGDGYLVAYTTPWAKVLIDGKDTGKMTPIAPRAKIALPPGKHKVTFVVGRESWSYTVTIKAGETSKLTKDLPVAAQ